MDYTVPLTAADFMDTLGIEKVVWDIERYDEFDTVGTGHDIPSEMAPPKWKAVLTMRDLYNADARAMAAKVRRLHGSLNAVMVYDPSHKYPAYDPGGTILAAATVQINSIGGDNQSLSLKGLPAGYVITIGDKGQVVFASGARNFFFEFSDTITANGSGVTGTVEIFPHIPIGVIADATVILKKPACKMTIIPGGFNPGQSSGNMTFGSAISAMEKI